MPKEKINKVAQFRKQAKFPTVTYVHYSKTEGKGKGCAIFRCAEPTHLLLNPGCEEDRLCAQKMSEKFTRIKTENPRSIKAQDVLIVYSPRTTQVQVHSSDKFGYENPALYGNVIPEWCGFNYDILKKSYQDIWKQMHNMHDKAEFKQEGIPNFL